MEEVVITGMGCVSALGNSPDILWDNLLQGKSGVAKIDRFDVSALPVQIAVFVTIVIVDVGIEDGPGDNHVGIVDQEGGLGVNRIPIERPVVLIDHAGVEAPHAGVGVIDSLEIVVDDELVLRQLAEMPVRAEEFLISRFRHIDQRIQNIFLTLEMIVQRRRFDPDLLGDLLHTRPVIAVIGKQRQSFIQYSISCCHHILQSKRLIIISFIITNNY